MLARAIDQLVRHEGPRVLAGLIRWSGDFDLAEEAFQAACEQALESWPRRGLPERPGGWLTTVARRRLADLLRRRRPSLPLEGPAPLAREPSSPAPRDDIAGSKAGATREGRFPPAYRAARVFRSARLRTSR